MKKLIYCIPALALALGACSNSETLSENCNGNEIRFDVRAEGATRADAGRVLYGPSNAPTDFTVFAYDAAGNLVIDGDGYTVGTGWASGVKRYWPEAGALTFKAVKNFSGSPEALAAVTVADPMTQADLLYTVQSATKASSANGAVTLNFRHALAQAVVAAKVTNQTLSVEVKGVALKNVKNSGTYALTDASTEGNIATEGAAYLTAGRGAWTLGSTTASYDVPVTAVTLGKSNTNAALTSTPMLLIPSKGLTAWSATNTAGSYIELTVKVTQKVKDSESAVTVHDGKIAVPVALNMDEGKKYYYTVTFGEGEGGIDPEHPDTPVFVPVTMTCTVDEFAKAEEAFSAN